MQYLTIWDLLLTPIYLIFLTAIAKKQRDKRYPPGHHLRKYYMKGLYVKFAGAIFIALIYQFYYRGGDTFNYFYHSQVINSSLNESIGTWFELITRTSVYHDPKLYTYVSQLYWYGDSHSYTVAVIGAIFGLLNGTTYIPIALLFAFFSYSGIWAMYRTFTNIYPYLYKELAIAFLFIPSTFVWGSAIFKDTVCMFGLGWLVYTTFRIFVNRHFSVKNLFMLCLSFYLVFVIKLYILLAFIPALSLWLLLTYSRRIRSSGVRWIVNICFIAFSIGGALFIAKRFASDLNKYSLDKIAETARITRSYIFSVSGDEGSGYDLGAMDGSIVGMLAKFPQGVVVTLFRPFLWEAKKVIVALSALESLAFLYLTLRLIFRNGKNVLKWTSKDPNLFFFLTFSLIFAFAVGVSSYNFGALSRYKIPCMPFYAAYLFVLMNKEKQFKIIRKNPNKTQSLQPAI